MLHFPFSNQPSASNDGNTVFGLQLFGLPLEYDSSHTRLLLSSLLLVFLPIFLFLSLCLARYNAQGIINSQGFFNTVAPR